MGCWWSSRGNIMCSRVISSGYLSFTIFWYSVIISPMFCVLISTEVWTSQGSKKITASCWLKINVNTGFLLLLEKPSDCNVWVSSCRNSGMSKTTTICKFTQKLEGLFPVKCILFSTRRIHTESILSALHQHLTTLLIVNQNKIWHSFPGDRQT